MRLPNKLRNHNESVGDKPFACFLLQPRLEPRDPIMSQRLIASLAAIFLAAAAEHSLAQEAVSTTSGSGVSSSTSGPSSASAPATTESSGTTTTISGAASSTAAPPLQSAPSGSGVFSPTPIKAYIVLYGGYDDNINTFSSNKHGSAFTGGNAILDYTFGDPRLQIALNAGAGGSYYYEQVSGGQNYDIDLKGAFGITYKSSPRLTLGSTVLVEYLTEPGFDAPGGLNSRNGNYLYTTDKIFFAYRWVSRFSTRTSYTFEAYNYDNSGVGAFSDRVSNTFGNEFLFQLVPTTSLVAEYRYEIVSYGTNSLDSTTQFALGGIDHQFNPRLSASVRGGAEFRSYDQGDDRTAPYLEGTVTYAVGKRTTVTWSSRYGIEEPDLAGSQSRTTFRTGLQTKFNLTSRISSSVDLYYVHDNYHSLSSAMPPTPGFSEDTFDGNLSAHYAITPLFGVSAGYHYTNINSDNAFREYSRNRVFAGVNLTF